MAALGELTQPRSIERGSDHTGAGTQLERIPVLIFDKPSQLSYQVARRIANLIQEYQAIGKKAVLGLPTGSTPIGVYQHLIRMHREEGLDFSNVVTFNLDEYYPMDPQALQSYHRFMFENFFDHVNIPRKQINIPRGDIPRDDVEGYCLTYEHNIRKAGGIDLLMLGIGRSGHIGFNEPGSDAETRTRMVVLDEITRKDAAGDFFGDENVPREAITMGIGTILDAREIILMATGEHKARIVRRAVEDEASRDVTASYLQLHRNATFYVDRAGAGELTREKTPWLVRPVEWDLPMSKRAVIWLSEKIQKAILRLEKGDFFRNHLHDLVYAYDSVDELCRVIFEDLRQRIMYRNQIISKKKVIVFSPHPDDDVISMGGMLDKLSANGNDVTVAYMTNGSVAVFDSDVRRELRFVDLSFNALDVEGEALSKLKDRQERIWKFLNNKKPGQIDLPEVQTLKANLRYAEAIGGLEVMGLHHSCARFLDMPFYRTGQVKKDPIGEADIQVVLDLLNDLQPEHIFVAGDLSDPHGTHRMCYVAIQQALERYKGADGKDLKQPPLDGGDAKEEVKAGNGKKAAPAAGRKAAPQVWLYRGAWQEWEIHSADVFIPLSKADLDRKIEAIFMHESQKDRAMYPGAYDEREFWQRARDRNRDTAEALNRLGLPEFYAAEAFVMTEKL